MRSTIAAAALLLIASAPAVAQPAPTLRVALEARTEGQSSREGTGARLYDEVRRRLLAVGDVEIVPAADARRIIWLIAGSGASPYAASIMVTERYDRETLMILGIEDDDMAARMMSLQIVNDHQIVTGADLADVARRIVASVDAGILARLRAAQPKG